MYTLQHFKRHLNINNKNTTTINLPARHFEFVVPAKVIAKQEGGPNLIVTIHILLF